MNEEPLPGTSAADQDVDRRWREQSAEEPSGLTDARIRAAARQATAGQEAHRAVRRSSPWTRFVPFAAAASVALLAVGLVRLIPPKEYELVPKLEAPRRDVPREAEPQPPPKTAASPGEGARPGMHYVAPPVPAARSDAAPREAESVLRQERERPAESRRAEPPEQPDRAADVTAKAAAAPGQNAVTTTAARPPEAFATTTPRAQASAPAAASEATAGLLAGVPRSSPDALESAMPDALAAQVRADAARRIGVDPASIAIVGVEPTAWPDRSLGCDQQRPDAPEALVPGYVVTVEALGTTLRYHTDDRDRIAVCEGE